MRRMTIIEDTVKSFELYAYIVHADNTRIRTVPISQ
ncbi:MAG: hypothetical protein ACI8RD_007040 [Bacillariaceae sp.]|jgi:hypothetical protein